MKLRDIPTGEYLKSYGIKPAVFNRLADIALRSWRGPAKTIRELPFFHSQELRAIAERDLASLSNMQKAEETKSILLLAGSIVEAILLDVIEKDPPTAILKAATVKANLEKSNPRTWKGFAPNDISSWTLAQMVGVCGPSGINVLSDSTMKIADLVRDFRNFVHPRKERDEMKQSLLLPEHATLAATLADIVIGEVARWHASGQAKGSQP